MCVCVRERGLVFLCEREVCLCVRARACTHVCVCSCAWGGLSPPPCGLCIPLTLQLGWMDWTGYLRSSVSDYQTGPSDSTTPTHSKGKRSNERTVCCCPFEHDDLNYTTQSTHSK